MIWTSNQKRACLEKFGFIVGDRDSRRNTAFKGKYMVAEPIDESRLPTEDARHDLCIVGDDLKSLINTAYESWIDD